MDAEGSVEKSIYTLADAYLAGFSDGSKVQKAIDRSETGDRGSGSPSGPRSETETKSAKTLLEEKEELADAAVEWAVQYLAQGEDQTKTSPASTTASLAGESFADAVTVIQPAVAFTGYETSEYTEYEPSLWHAGYGGQEEYYGPHGAGIIEDGRDAAGLATEACSPGQNGSLVNNINDVHSRTLTNPDASPLITAPF